MFFSMVIAQAQRIDLESDALVFTFTPAHKTLRAQLEAKKAWLEQLTMQVAGHRMKVVTREGQAAPVAEVSQTDAASKQAELRARAKAEPVVQAVLDVFGGEIEDVEETK
jgi:hypothetical protein